MSLLNENTYEKHFKKIIKLVIAKKLELAKKNGAYIQTQRLKIYKNQMPTVKHGGCNIMVWVSFSHYSIDQ